MAPTPPSRPSKSILKTSKPNNSQEDSLFPSSKKDKRRIKHAQILSKVAKSSKQSSRPKRRRLNKKLTTTLESLADALPDDVWDEDGTNNGIKSTSAASQVNVIKRKSLKSRPGAMKRREKVDASERDRFAKNMAQMMAPIQTSNGDKVVSQSTVPTTSDRLAALRGFISQTLETRPEVVG